MVSCVENKVSMKVM